MAANQSSYDPLKDSESCSNASDIVSSYPPANSDSEAKNHKKKNEKTRRELFLLPKKVFFYYQNDRRFCISRTKFGIQSSFTWLITWCCPFKEKRKFTGQPNFPRGLIKEEKKVISEPSSLRGLIEEEEENKGKIPLCKLSHTFSMVELVPREAQEGLENKFKKMTRHEENYEILKKFLKVCQEKEGGNDEGVFLASSFPSSVSEVEERVKKMATKLAMVSLRKWMFTLLDGPEEKISDSDIGIAMEEIFFNSIAKWILHTFDMEDIERFNCYDKLEAEYRRFYGDNLLHLKKFDDAYKLTAEGKINFDGFPLLREPDIGFILFGYMFGALHNVVKVDSCYGVRMMKFRFPSYNECYFKEECHGRFVEMARTVLLQHVPMDEDMKIHSILEFVVCPCVSTLDAFRCEALSNACNLGVEKNLKHNTLKLVASLIDDLMASLTFERYKDLRGMSTGVTFVLKYGPFGLFADEVCDLVNIAEARRRFQGHRYISKHHIFWAVGLTRIKDFTDRLVEGIGLRNLVEEPATCPPYSLYMSARMTADIHGFKVVGVEHIVVATMFEMSQRKNLNEFNDESCVKEFLDAVRNYKKEHGYEDDDYDADDDDDDDDEY